MTPTDIALIRSCLARVTPRGDAEAKAIDELHDRLGRRPDLADVLRHWLAAQMRASTDDEVAAYNAVLVRINRYVKEGK